VCVHVFIAPQRNNRRKRAYIGMVMIIFLIVNIDTWMYARDAIAVPGGKLVSE
jgi:hypothetical protein